MSDSATGKKQKWVRPTLIAIGIIGVLGLVAAITTLRGNQVNAQTTIDVKVMPVATFTVEKVSSLERVRRFTGVVKTERATDISFENMGTLKKVHVKEGQYVKENDLLAELDDRVLVARQKQLKALLEIETQRWNELKNGPRKQTIDAAKARVDSLQAQYAQAQKDVQRRQPLRDSGAISAEEWDRTLANRNTLKANLDSAQKQLDELNAGTREEQKAAQKAAVEQVQANLEDIGIRIEKSKIRAKFNGRIAQQYLDEGSIINAGVLVLRLVESDKLEAWVGIPPAVFADMEKSGEHSLLIAGKNYKGTFKYALPEIDRATRTRQIVLAIQADWSQVAPGQIVRFTSRTSESIDGIWIPTESMTPAARGLWTVYVVEQQGSNWVVGKREVDVVSTDGDFVLVRGTLQAGDRIVAKGAHRVTTGQLVEPSETEIAVPTGR